MLRDHLRRRPAQRRRPQAVDGVLNAPVRSGTARAAASQRMMQGSDTFRSTTSRSVDSFRRREGFHAANQAQGDKRAQLSKAQLGKQSSSRDQQASILHMTLPGSPLSGQEQKVKKKRGGWRNMRRWTLRSAVVLSVLAVLIGGGFLLRSFFGANQVFRGGGHAEALSCGAEVDPVRLQSEGSGRVNILLVGLDDAAALTDTILLTSIDPANSTSATVSVPRDLWVNNPAGGSSKINAVYPLAMQAELASNPNDQSAAERAGIGALESVVEEVLGIDVHYYVTVDVAGFERAVDVVGGVTMDVPEELAVSEQLWDDVRGEPYFLNVPAGEQEFDAQRALFFVRSRHTSPRGDFDRTERQRLFLQALARQVASSGTYTNPVRITRLMDTFSDHVATNLSVDDAYCLSKIATDIRSDEMQSIGLADPPDPVVTTGVLGDQSIVQPIAGIGNYSDIHMLIRSQLVDGYISRENARILVLNGTAVPGQAADTAAELESYGYNIVDVGDAPTSDYERTAIVSLRGDNKPYTMHYLQKRLGVQATSNVPDDLGLQQDDNSDFVIILGNR